MRIKIRQIPHASYWVCNCQDIVTCGSTLIVAYHRHSRWQRS